MAKKMLRWVLFSLLFALVPLIVVVTLRWLAGKLTINTLEDNSSEILFFALMVSVTVAGDMVEVYRRIGKDTLVYALMMFFIVGAVCSSVLYGFLHFDLLIGANIEGFRSRLMWLSIALGVVLFLVGTATQVFLARITHQEENER